MAMIRPISLSDAHMECRSLTATVPVMTDLLGFEQMASSAGEVTLRHPHSEWRLIVHEAEQPFPDRPRHHHFGVRVEHKSEIDAAYEYLNAHRDEYGVLEIDPQVTRHGSYSVHFEEPGTNFWEIECYEDVLRKDSGTERLGGVRSRHWSEAGGETAAPGRGYQPLAFTHGTLGCTDAEATGRFASEVLGLDVHKAYANVRYIKHPASKHFVVCLQAEGVNAYSPNFRFTLGLESASAVEEARAWLTKSDFGLLELGPLQTPGDRASFLIRDMNGNCWELAGPSGG
jgi:catechol 2,3-dioxygenase-like lactoylglutathione lyase family enzyme